MTKTIPAISKQRKSVTDSIQHQLPYDHNRAQQVMKGDASEETPTDENLVDDDIIEENSHTLTPVKPQTPTGQRPQTSQ